MTENPQFDKVKEFNLTFGHAVRDEPSLDHEDIPMRLVDVFFEESLEVVFAYMSYLYTKANAADTVEERKMYSSRYHKTGARLAKNLIDVMSSLTALGSRLEDRSDEVFDKDTRDNFSESSFENMVLFLDGLADTEVVLNGLAQATGMPITEAFNVAHDSNMSKLGPDGKPMYHPEDHPKAGKIAKGPNFWEPHEKFAELIERG